MSRLGFAGALMAVIFTAGSALAQAQTTGSSRLPRVVLEAADDGVALRRAAEAATLPFPIGLRLRTSAADRLDDVDGRLSAFDRAGASVWLALPAPAALEGADAFRQQLRIVADRHRDSLVAIELQFDRQSPDLIRFITQAIATEVRALGSPARVAIGGPAMEDEARRREIYDAALAPYVDLLVLPATAADAADTWLRELDSPVAVAVVAAAGGQDLIARVVGDLGSRITTRAWQSDEVPTPALRALAPLAPLMTHAIAVLDDAAAGLQIRSGTGDLPVTLPHRMLIDNDTLSRYLWYATASPSESPLQVSLTLSVNGQPVAIDLSTAQPLPAVAVQRDSDAGRVQLTLPQTGQPVLVALDEEGLLIGDRTEVVAERALRVEEIIARHQQQQRAQDVRLTSYIAHARMEQHFRPTVADAGYDVVAENTYFVTGDGVEWEELSFSVNGSKWGADRPPFPLLQPDKVLALPLQLRFDEGYRYRLDGTERIDGVDCYVVKFEPIRQDNALYRGTVWIDRRTFARIRVHAVQSGLPAPVVSNDEIQRFTPIEVPGGAPIYLFTELTARQILLVAGRNLLVEKKVLFSDFEINHRDFADRRAAARDSENVMYRETADGLRYFVKDGDTRVVSERGALGVRALAMGVTLDPSYAFPLPILGINYVDFQFGRPDTQLAVLFAGVLAAGNIQRSQILGKKVDASVDFFAIAVPSTDRLFGPEGDDPETRLLTWPLSTGLNLGWQPTPYMRAALQYQFRFDAYIRDRTTRETFEPPASTVTNGIGGSWEYRRGGYSLVANGTLFKRASWRAWGDGIETPDSYIKYSVNLTRDFYFGPFQKLHFNGAWFSGRDLDRFGKYQFGMFDDTRIHGVPGGGVRYADLAMARTTYSVNVFEQYRVDLFFEHAWGRDENGRGRWDRVPGTGFALNLRAPWNTILRAEFGKSNLPDRYQHLGSTTLQIMLLKPLK